MEDSSSKLLAVGAEDDKGVSLLELLGSCIQKCS